MSLKSIDQRPPISTIRISPDQQQNDQLLDALHNQKRPRRYEMGRVQRLLLNAVGMTLLVVLRFLPKRTWM